MPFRKFRVGKQNIITILRQLQESGKMEVAQELAVLIFGNEPEINRIRSFGVTRFTISHKEDYDVGNKPKGFRSTL